MEHLCSEFPKSVNGPAGELSGRKHFLSDGVSLMTRVQFWNPRTGEREELNAQSCLLTSTLSPWQTCAHVYIHALVPTHRHTITIINNFDWHWFSTQCHLALHFQSSQLKVWWLTPAIPALEAEAGESSQG